MTTYKAIQNSYKNNTTLTDRYTFDSSTGYMYNNWGYGTFNTGEKIEFFSAATRYIEVVICVSFNQLSYFNDGEVFSLIPNNRYDTKVVIFLHPELSSHKIGCKTTNNTEEIISNYIINENQFYWLKYNAERNGKQTVSVSTDGINYTSIIQLTNLFGSSSIYSLQNNVMDPYGNVIFDFKNSNISTFSRSGDTLTLYRYYELASPEYKTVLNNQKYYIVNN